MARTGRRSMIHDWLEPEKLLLLRHWKRHGLTNKQVAKNIGVSVKTLYQWAAKESDIRDALKSGKQEAIAIVENKLYLKAVSGNMTAIVFYLKNNARHMYNDSKLSAEEQELEKAQVRKARAEAEIAEMRAKQVETVADKVSDKLSTLDKDTLIKLSRLDESDDGKND